MNTELSGNISSMWNRKRCSVYSSTVHTKFPNRKHAIVSPSEAEVADERYGAVNGRVGAARNGGRGREKPTRERRNRLRAMGSQIIGTMYHFVRVKTWGGRRDSKEGRIKSFE